MTARKPVYAIDLETTGLSPLQGDRVFEIAAVRVDREAEQFQALINCGVNIPKNIEKLCGIRTADLQAGVFPDVAFRDFKDFVGNGILVAHNASFDRSFLRYEYNNLGFDFSNSIRCTLKLYKKARPRLPGYSLRYLAKKILNLDLERGGRHRALSDALVVALLWKNLRKA